MPPKKVPDKVNKKTEQKKKDKIIEDKTFGLKNKKGAKNQKFIAQVEKQVKFGGDPKTRKVEEEKLAEKKRREDAKKAEEDKKLLFKPVATQKVEQGVDPKSVFCAFFKQGLCKKGDKCKFSHDPAVERKAAKRNIYADEEEEEDTMDNWDDAMLQEVVAKKHGEERSNQTGIICKYFLDALESSKYGWFWTCPNGGTNCMYRHALPNGYVLKKDKRAQDKAGENTLSIEELIEQKRAELSARPVLTPVTLHTFVQWKKRKLKEKAERALKEEEKKKDKFKSGVTIGLSGREMFSYNPTMFDDAGEDDEDGGEYWDLSKMERDTDENEDPNVKVHEIKFDEFGIMDDGVDDSTAKQLETLMQDQGPESKLQSDSDLMDGAVAAGPIDEDLFQDEDLDELEEDLGQLAV